MLVAWYTALCNRYSKCITPFFSVLVESRDRKRPRAFDHHRNARFRTVRPVGHTRYLLLVQVCPFLAWMTTVNLPCIDSQHVSRLRSVFILTLSSPVSPSFLHLAYPTSTLSLLCVDTFVAPAGLHILEKAFQQVSYFWQTVTYADDSLDIL